MVNSLVEQNNDIIAYCWQRVTKKIRVSTQTRLFNDLAIEILSARDLRALYTGDYDFTQILNTAKAVGLFTTS